MTLTSRLLPLGLMLLLGTAVMLPQQPQGSTDSFSHDGGRHMHGGIGKWWDNPEVVQQLGLSADQQKKMDAIFEQNRDRLTQLHDALHQQEQTMEPLMQAEHPDEAQIDAQIDRMAQARAELEKAHSRMLLSLRALMTQEQWEKLRALQPPPGAMHMRRQHPTSDPGGPPPQD